MNYKETNLPKRDEHNFHSPALTTRGQQPDAAVTCLVQLVAPTWSERNCWTDRSCDCRYYCYYHPVTHRRGGIVKRKK